MTVRPLDPRVTPWAVAAVSAAVAVMAWNGGFRPAAIAVHAAAVGAEALASQTAAVDVMLLAAGGEPAWRTRQAARLQAMQARLPKQEQLPGVLNVVDAIFRQGRLTLRNVSQGNVEPVNASVPVMVPPADGVSAPTLACFRLPLTVVAEGRYHELVDAIDQLTRSEFPALVSVESVQLQRQGDGPQVAATIALTVYLAGLPR